MRLELHRDSTSDAEGSRLSESSSLIGVRLSLPVPALWLPEGVPAKLRVMECLGVPCFGVIPGVASLDDEFMRTGEGSGTKAASGGFMLRLLLLLRLSRLLLLLLRLSWRLVFGTGLLMTGDLLSPLASRRTASRSSFIKSLSTNSSDSGGYPVFAGRRGGGVNQSCLLFKADGSFGH
jgi:hypothetical protein